jgi:hypothetical protein
MTFSYKNKSYQNIQVTLYQEKLYKEYFHNVQKSSNNQIK